MLIDNFGREQTYLRIAVTDRCNMRCTYCMPAQGIEWHKPGEILTDEEICRLARIFVDMGIRKIRLTGGEPTIRTGILSLVKQLASISGLDTLAMTTNGTRLADIAVSLKKNGLTNMNISLDTLKRDRFIRIAGRDLLDHVLEGIHTAMSAGFVPLKLNTVIINGLNDDELLDFVEFVRNKPINLRFIEYMPFQNNQWDYDRFIPYRKMMDRIQERYSLEPLDHSKGSTAKEFGIEGFMGSVGFITPISSEFCETCSRLRLTSDGSLRLCLFHLTNVSLKEALRDGASDDEIRRTLSQAMMLKPERHPITDKLALFNDRNMVQIGG